MWLPTVDFLSSFQDERTGPYPSDNVRFFGGSRRSELSTENKFSCLCTPKEPKLGQTQMKASNARWASGLLLHLVD